MQEIDGGDRLRKLRGELRASPPARAFAKYSPSRSSVGEEDFYRPAKEAFVAEVAEQAIDLARSEKMAGVFLVAPARLVGPLRACLEERISVEGLLRKNLTKAPDHELGVWLDQTLIRKGA